MRVADAVAEILRREGVGFIVCYPVNPIIEACADADIRTILVRQVRGRASTWRDAVSTRPTRCRAAIIMFAMQLFDASGSRPRSDASAVAEVLAGDAVSGS